MEAYWTISSWIMLLLGVALLAMEAYALVNAIRRRKDAFPASGNQTKVFWLALLGISVAVGFVMVTNPINIFSLIAVVIAGVYLVKVRPGIISITGGRGSGPYGGY